MYVLLFRKLVPTVLIDTVIHVIDVMMHAYTLIIHEMLRKKGKATQHNRKTKQHNTTRPRQYFSKKNAASGGTCT